MKDRMHVCYCVNRKVLSPLCVSVYTAAKSTQGIPRTVWVFQTDLTPNGIDELHDILGAFPECRLKVRSIDLSVFSEIKGLHGEVVPFGKLLLPRLMEGEADRIIFLDADTVVVNGLGDLYQKDLEGHLLGAVSYESLGRTQEAEFFQAKGLDLEKDSFNSGVMLIDVEGWSANRKTERLIEEVKAVEPQEAEGDQPFLNVSFYDDFVPLRIRYNKRAGPDTRLEKKHTTDGILHFVGIPKPWDVGGVWFNKNSHLYEKYRRQAGVSKRSSVDEIRDKGWRRAVKGLSAGLRAALRSGKSKILSEVMAAVL